MHGETMRSWRLGTLGARHPPQSPQLATKESIMEEHTPKEKWHSVTTFLGGKVQLFAHSDSCTLLYIFSPIVPQISMGGLAIFSCYGSFQFSFWPLGFALSIYGGFKFPGLFCIPYIEASRRSRRTSPVLSRRRGAIEASRWRRGAVEASRRPIC